MSDDLRFGPDEMPQGLVGDLGPHTANLVTGYDFTDKGVCISFAKPCGSASLENRIPIMCSVQDLGTDSRGHTIYHIRTEWDD